MDALSITASAFSIFQIFSQALFLTKSIQEQTPNSIFKRSKRNLDDLRHQLDTLSSSLEQIRLNVQNKDSLTKASAVADENVLGVLAVGEEVLGNISQSLQRVESSSRKGSILPQIRRNVGYSKDVELGTQRLQTCWELVSIAISRQLLYSVKSGNTKLDPSLQMIKYDFPNAVKTIDQRVLDWLTGFDYQSRHEELRQLWAPGTGIWLLDDSETFRSWFLGNAVEGQRRPSNVLWCYGIPGSGKSIMMSSVVDHILEESEKDHSTGVAYFYFDYQIKVSPQDIIASLLKQLCLQKDMIPPSIVQSWELQENKDHTSSQESLKSERVPKYRELLAAFLTVASKFRRTYVCLDALDECTEEHQHALQEILQRLSQSRCSLLTTSRYEQQYIELFSHVPQIHIEATSEDIGHYVSSVLDQHPELSDMVDKSLQRKISHVLAEKSKGMFLFTALQMQQILDQTSVSEVKDTLQSMPETLHDVYASMLNSIGEQSSNRSSLAIRILMWLSYSTRSLTVPELQHAVAIDVEASTLNPERVPPARFIEDVCMGLVTIDKERNVVLLTHSSLKHYLIQLRESLFSHGTSHTAKSCLAYFNYSEFGNGPCKSEIAYRKRLDDYPFAVYVAQYWGTHLQSWMKIDDDEISSRIYDLFDDDQRLASFSQLMYAAEKPEMYQEYPRGMSGLNFAAYFGLLLPAHYCLKKMKLAPQPDSWNRGALHLACEQGHKNMAQLMIDLKTNLDIQDKDGRTAVHYAALKGHVALVDLLASKRAELNTQDRQGKTAVEHAAYNGHFEVVSKLLEFDIDASNGLSIAASTGHSKIVELLLNAGKDSDEDLALIEAARSGFEDIVTILLERGADLNFMDDKHMTALHFAAAEGRTEMTELLLMNGSNIQAQDRKGRTALYLAAEKGDEPTVKILAEYGAEIEARTLEGRTALTESAATGNAGIVELLLRRGATVDSTNSSTSTDSTASEEVQKNALQAAANRGHVSVVRLLLEKYSYPNCRGTTDRTPLSYAAEGGHEEVVRLLLQFDEVDVNACDRNGRTPLSYAAENGNAATVSLLLSLDKVDENMTDGLGRSALSYAAERGHTECVKLLLSQGGVDPTLKDSEGLDALAYSTQSRHTEVRRILSHLPYNPHTTIRSSTTTYTRRVPYGISLRHSNTRA